MSLGRLIWQGIVETWNGLKCLHRPAWGRMEGRALTGPCILSLYQNLLTISAFQILRFLAWEHYQCCNTLKKKSLQLTLSNTTSWIFVIPFTEHWKPRIVLIAPRSCNKCIGLERIIKQLTFQKLFAFWCPLPSSINVLRKATVWVGMREVSSL